MKAIFLTSYGRPADVLQIRDVETPAPGEDELLVKVEASGLNYADIMAISGFYKAAPKPPSILGYEIVGRVESAGTNVPEEWIGKRILSFVRFGGFSEYVIAKKDAIAEISENIKAGEAAALATQYATAWHAAYDLANLRGYETIALHAAAGGVGTAIIQLARLNGCKIIAMCGSDEKIKYLEDQKADYIINYRKVDYKKEIEKITGKKSVNVIFNSVGGSTFRKDMQLLAPGGKSVLYGMAERSGGKFGIFSTLGLVFRMGTIIPAKLMMSSQSILTANLLAIGDSNPLVLKNALSGVIQLMNENKISPVTGGEFHYSQAHKAFELLASRNSTGKIIIQWN